MEPPSPMPSKNWWKVKAAIRGLIVLGLSDAPREIPIITECTTIPNSSTCNAIFKHQNHNYNTHTKKWYNVYNSQRCSLISLRKRFSVT